VKVSYYCPLALKDKTFDVTHWRLLEGGGNLSQKEYHKLKVQGPEQ
jgi:hypothetical protein